MKNEYSSISFSWNETSATLTVGKRAGGGFKNMLQERTFNIILVKEGHGTGLDIEMRPDHILHYKGEKVVVQL